ncbi:hypothetical protein [Burkholderia ambifaria]|nr:hypothetical protein [Burkholderia ambifaria]
MADFPNDITNPTQASAGEVATTLNGTLDILRTLFMPTGADITAKKILTAEELGKRYNVKFTSAVVANDRAITLPTALAPQLNYVVMLHNTGDTEALIKAASDETINGQSALKLLFNESVILTVAAPKTWSVLLRGGRSIEDESASGGQLSEAVLGNNGFNSALVQLSKEQFRSSVDTATAGDGQLSNAVLGNNGFNSALVQLSKEQFRSSVDTATASGGQLSNAVLGNNGFHDALVQLCKEVVVAELAKRGATAQ